MLNCTALLVVSLFAHCVFFKKCVFTCTYVHAFTPYGLTVYVHMAWLEGEDRRKVGGREGEVTVGREEGRRVDKVGIEREG